MHRTPVLLTLCLLALPLAVRGETLAEAWATALGAHQGIAAAEAELDAAGYDLESARTARLPKVGLSTDYLRLDAAPAFAFGDGLTTPPVFDGDDFVRAGAMVGLPLYAGGGIRAGVAAAESGEAAAAARLAGVVQDVKLAVAERFVAVLRAESAVDVAESIVASLATHTENTKNRFEFGAVPQNDYLAASVTLANARQRLTTAGNGLDYARADYNRVLGRPLSAAVALDPALDIDGLVPAGHGLTQLIEIARENRPRLAALERQALALSSRSDAARAAGRPRLALTGGYMFLENEFLDDDAFWMAGLSLSWNLFDAGESRKRAAALDSRASALRHSRADMESSVALEVRRAWNDRLEAESRLDVAARAVEQASENLRVVRNRYDAGASTNVEVLDAEALREQALSNRDDARYEVALAKLRLARATGML